jgi:Ankyrin repeats (3 copies)/G-patch domain
MWHKNYPFKRFVKAAEPSCGGGSSVKHEVGVTEEEEMQRKGEQLRNFYEDLTRDVKTETIKCEVKKEERLDDEIVLDDDDDEEVMVVGDSSAENRFLTAVQQADSIDLVRRLFSDEASGLRLLECRDRYGWSPLMVAAAAGRRDTVEFLLAQGADVAVRDPRSGQTALDLARRMGHSEVADLLQRWASGRGPQQQWPGGPARISDTTEFEACQTCGELYVSEERNQHVASVPHQLAAELRRDRLPPRPGFGLSATNRGYQLLVKSGWDERSGLGPDEEHRGRLFPVKSVLKRDRIGLGGGDSGDEVRSSREAKVTHFGPHDVRSVESQRPASQGGGGYCKNCHKKNEADVCGCRERAIRQDLWEL